jgi:Spy/CpxP family protein refolding chaperone
VSPWKVILATMVIFGCGVVTGALLIKTELPAAAAMTTPEAPAHPGNSTNPPPPWANVQRPEFWRRMEKQLDLTPAQRDQITEIVRQSQERSRPLWEAIAPQMRAEIRRVRGEIRDVLTPDQQKKFDELMKSRPRKAREPGPTNQPPGETPTPTPTNAL